MSFSNFFFISLSNDCAPLCISLNFFNLSKIFFFILSLVALFNLSKAFLKSLFFFKLLINFSFNFLFKSLSRSSKAFWVSAFFLSLSIKSFLSLSELFLNNLSKTLNPSLMPVFFFNVSNAFFFGSIFNNLSNFWTAFAISLSLFNLSKKSFFNLSSLSFFAFDNISFNFLAKLSKLSFFIWFAAFLHLLKHSLKSCLSLIFCKSSSTFLNLSSFCFCFFNKSFNLSFNLSIISLLLARFFHLSIYFFKSFFLL